MLDDCCRRHSFKTRERGLGELVLRVCKECLQLAVYVLRREPSKIRRVAVRE